MAITITNITDLQKIGNDPSYPLDGDYELGNDIDASATSGWNAGAGFDPLGEIGFMGNPDLVFSGTLDGKGYSITGLVINRPTESYVGIFSYVSAGTIKNIKLVDFSITGDSDYNTGWGGGCLSGRVGADSLFTDIDVMNCSVNCTSASGLLIGSSFVGSSVSPPVYTNCHTFGIIDGGGEAYGVGGLLGDSYSSVLINCSSSAKIIGAATVGGLVGVEYDAITLSECNFTGTIDLSTTSGVYAVGGLVGDMYDECTATGCYVESDFSIEDSTEIAFVGGLFGLSYGGGFPLEQVEIYRCHFKGTISLSAPEIIYVGGLTSWIPDGHNNISKCYTGGTINCTSPDVYAVAGFIGSLEHTNIGSVSIDNCYSVVDILCSTPNNQEIGGFVGSVWGPVALENCYSATVLPTGGTDIGGFIGYDSSGGSYVIETSCFWDTETSGIATSDGGTGKTTAEMKTCSTFTGVGWDYVTIWEQELNVSYPVFGNRGCYYLGFKGPTIIFD